jgi:hypothetical protein
LVSRSRRGETSHIRIWAPCPPSKKKLAAWRDAGADPADKSRTYFWLEAVFTQAQVEALPPPAEPAPLDPPICELEGDSLAWARQPLEDLAGELGYTVTYRALAKGHGGSCEPAAKLLTINSGQEVNAQVDVLCHELAQVLVRVDRRDDDPRLGYADEEPSSSRSCTSRCPSSACAATPRQCPIWRPGARARRADTFEQIAGLVNAWPAAWRRPWAPRNASRSARRAPRRRTRAGCRSLRPGLTRGPSQAARARVNPPHQLHPGFARTAPSGLGAGACVRPRAGCRPTVPE